MDKCGILRMIAGILGKWLWEVAYAVTKWLPEETCSIRAGDAHMMLPRQNTDQPLCRKNVKSAGHLPFNAKHGFGEKQHLT